MILIIRVIISVIMLVGAFDGFGDIVNHGEKFHYVTYFHHTGELIKVGWDNAEENLPLVPTYYKFSLIQIEQDQIISKPDWEHIGGTGITFTLPYVGHWVARVSACYPNPESTEEKPIPDICSDWALSTQPDNAFVDYEPLGWWMYGFLAPPTGGGVESGK